MKNELLTKRYLVQKNKELISKQFRLFVAQMGIAMKVLTDKYVFDDRGVV